MSEATKEDLVSLVDVLGEEYLLYKMPKLNIGLIRGTTADEHGNITMEEEGAPIDALDVALAVKAMGGKVIASHSAVSLFLMVATFAANYIFGVNVVLIILAAALFGVVRAALARKRTV